MQKISKVSESRKTNLMIKNSKNKFLKDKVSSMKNLNTLTTFTGVSSKFIFHEQISFNELFKLDTHLIMSLSNSTSF